MNHQKPVHSGQKNIDDYTMPVIVRAREYFLYDRFGTRYLDFYQNNGRAILGHRPQGVQRALKSTVSRGLVAEYPSLYTGRLEKLMTHVIPSHPFVRVYRDERSLQEALHEVVGDKAFSPHDPLSGDCGKDSELAYWRPYLGLCGEESAILLPILPFPGSFTPKVVCLRDEKLAQAMPSSETCSPLLLELLIRSTVALQASLKDVSLMWNDPFQGAFGVPRGPYVTTGLDAERYELFRREALACHIVVPPTPGEPIILPPRWSQGDVAGLVRVAQSFSR
mgnify:CR=1 FL=1